MSKSEETLSAIVEASYRLFAGHGIAKTTYTMIAEEVGIAKPSIYYYFKSKDALIEGIFDELCASVAVLLILSYRRIYERAISLRNVLKLALK